MMLRHDEGMQDRGVTPGKIVVVAATPSLSSGGGGTRACACVRRAKREGMGESKRQEEEG